MNTLRALFLLGAMLFCIGVQSVRADESDDMIEAVKANDMARINALIQLDEIQRLIKKDDGGNLFAYLIDVGTADVVKLFIDNGANVNGTYNGKTALLLCLKNKCQQKAEKMKLLIAAGADVNKVSQMSNGMMPTIVYAADVPELLRILIDAGADVNARETNSRLEFTPLMWAVSASPPAIESVRMLIEAGADLNVRDSARGKTVLGIAKQYKKQAGYDDVIKLLKSAGAK